MFSPMSPVPEKHTIFTIGHSNHPIDTFIDMLKVAEIDAVHARREQQQAACSGGAARSTG